MKTYKILSLLIIPILIVSSCSKPKPRPKPVAYFRINLPKHEYTLYNPDSCPFEFEIPTYTKIVPDKENPDKKCWFNIKFPSLKASISITYYPITDSVKLEQLIDDSYELAYKHSIRADDIIEQVFIDSTDRVFAKIFEITGNAASQYQFYITDSTQHFFRGSLYFYAQPNSDSLRPAVQFIKKDIEHLIHTFKWK